MMFETAIVTIPVDFNRWMEQLRQHANAKESIRKRIKQVGSGYALMIVNEFGKTTKTWSWDVPFHHKVDWSGDTLEITVYTEDTIYGFVNNGTGIRYATMTEDFSAKTIPGHIGSYHGSGGLAYVNKKVERPGIVARSFDETIADENWEYITEKMQDAMEKEINDMFGGW
jgi:hypothetical protein